MSSEPSSSTPEESPARQPPRALRTFQSLVIPEYRNYSIAMFFFFAAMEMMQLARPLLAFELSVDEAGERSFLAFGLTLATSGMLSPFVSPWAGTIADRMSMRVLLQRCALVLAAIAAVFAVGVILDVLTWWHVAIIGAFVGATNNFVTPTRRAIVSQVVPKSYLLNAVSLHTVNLNVNRMLMPATAGFIIHHVGFAWSFWLIVAIYIVAFGLLFAVPARWREAEANRGRSMAGALGDGFRYAIKSPIIRWVLLVGFVVTLFGQPIQRLLPMFQDVLQVGPFEIGLLFTAMGIGSLLGSTTSASLGDFKKKGLLLVGFFTILGAAIIAFSLSNYYLLSLFLMVPLGFGHSGRTAVHLAVLQTYTEPAMRGRVMAINNMGGLAPVSILGIAFLADLIGPQFSVAAAGAVVLVVGIWAIFFARPLRSIA